MYQINCVFHKTAVIDLKSPGFRVCMLVPVLFHNSLLTLNQFLTHIIHRLISATVSVSYFWNWEFCPNGAKPSSLLRKTNYIPYLKGWGWFFWILKNLQTLEVYVKHKNKIWKKCMQSDSYWVGSQPHLPASDIDWGNFVFLWKGSFERPFSFDKLWFLHVVILEIHFSDRHVI